MVWMDFVEHDPPTELEQDMLRFANDRMAELVRFHIDLANDVNGENYEMLFPSRFYYEHKEKCGLIVNELYDAICSYVILSELPPIYRYVLFHVLEAYDEPCKSVSDAPEFQRFKLPEELKARIYNEIINTPEYDLEDDGEEPFLIECLECPSMYIDNCFEDTDFLEDDLRELAEEAMGRDPVLFLSKMDYEELDQYIDLMPGDVADRYIAYREKLNKAV